MKGCDVSGCQRPPRSPRSKYCEVHYYRLRRTGTVELTEWEQRIPNSGGYLMAKTEDRPLANGRFREYEHRVVYYDAYGAGPFKCHWCGKELTWTTLHIDHLDDNKQNNALSNLVASCPPCNQGRGKQKMIAAKSAWLEFNGERLTVAQWATRLGIRRGSIVWRLKHGWPVGKALTAPRGTTGPRQRL